MTTTQTHGKSVKDLERVVIRFAGDSGDGMQLTGDRFTSASAVFGNDVATLPDFPAEIRAPAGTVAGVSSFQVHFANYDILTPGDQPSVLIAMNPAALKKNVRDVVTGGLVVVNGDAFTEANLKKAGYEANPLEDDSLSSFQVVEVPLTSLTLEALKEFDISKKEAERAKNMFALGIVTWMYHRPPEPTIEWIERKFAKQEEIARANVQAFKKGIDFGETTELFAASYHVRPAELPPGKYRNITGNVAIAYGLVAASQLSGLPLFLGSYPITPASDVLQELARHKNFGVRTFQAEDEISAVGSALGAAFAGSLGVTCTSGPGLDLKAETIGLAVAVELPLIVLDIQRGGPSTGLPTKTEQSDLLQAVFGRHGEAPAPVIAAYAPTHCFEAAIEAARIALKYRTPVYLLSDTYLANGAEPWRLPDVDSLPDMRVVFTTEPNHDGEFWPFQRDPETLARPWAIPGTPGLEHRIGGLEHADGTGNISYDPENHDLMTRLRAEKVAGIADDIPEVDVDEDPGAEVLVLGWGSTYGTIIAACRRLRARQRRIARAHLVHLNPFPRNLGDVVKRYRKVVIPEINTGHLRRLIRSEFLVDAVGYNKVRGLPFRAAELEEFLLEAIDHD
jgi:2-oxoglutarate ferredoxin oxidoreductase subunit alpha